MTISAKIIADSISQQGIRITTFELEYPRFIHAEFMTHRLFSRNAQSSRAVPIAKQIEQVEQNTAMPIHWGKHQPGMQANEECDAFIQLLNDEGLPNWELTREETWEIARDRAVEVAQAFADAGYHKQIVNRLLEPFSHIKVVCTATEYDNFFWLRKHPDAQPEIQELAERMWEAREASTPVELSVGEWHVPYFKDGYIKPDQDPYAIEMGIYDEQVSLALAISSSCCAQVSYRKLDDSIEKAQKIYQMLVEAEPPHFSPFEHQATPMSQQPDLNQAGVTHMDSLQKYWLGNFRGWTQHRQLIMAEKGLESMSCRKT